MKKTFAKLLVFGMVLSMMAIPAMAATNYQWYNANLTVTATTVTDASQAMIEFVDNQTDYDYQINSGVTTLHVGGTVLGGTLTINGGKVLLLNANFSDSAPLTVNSSANKDFAYETGKDASSIIVTPMNGYTAGWEVDGNYTYLTWTYNGGGSGGSGGGGGGGGAGGSSSGGSGSSTGTDAAKTETTKNADGSTTTTTTESDGSVGTVKTDANGNVTEIEATVSEKAVTNADTGDNVITLPIEASVAESAEEATEIKVTMPSSVSSSNKAEVEIPVANVSETTVVVLVKEDGTEEIIKDAALTEDGLVITAEGSFTVKIIDNAKSFNDSIPDWAADAVAFVTAREIFNGDGSNFNAEAKMTRGMLAQVLFNFDSDAEAGTASPFGDVSNSDFYADAAAWCASKSIMNGTGDGFDGDASITREQLVVTLYRYAQAKGYDVSASASLSGFGDASDVSDYATAAMSWAIGSGLINGMDGNLNAQGDATRGQIAAVMQRFCQNIAH